MMPKAEHTKIQSEIEVQDSGTDGMCLTENIQAQLEEARFISSFMSAVCTSLELDGICSIAARAIYDHVPYHRIVFTFSEALEERTITYSPMFQKGVLEVRPRIAVANSNSLSYLNENSLASVHLNLHDNTGTIAIYYKAEQGKTFSDALFTSMASCFSQAIRNALQHSKMKDLAMRDCLTGLYNRRIFDETLAQKVKSPNSRPVSLLLIDVDNFKQVNDTFGHQAGDQVLKTLAKILKESCRGNDLVARFGGEEFAIILSQTKAATAHAIAQRIRCRLAKTEFNFDGRQLQITASIGLSTCREENAIYSSNLVNQADRALYQAKMTGKNKVCVFPADLLEDSTFSLGLESFGSFASANC